MKATAETIRCRKCKAVGIRHFVRRTEYLLDEKGAVDSIICLICGDRLASRPLVEKMTRTVPPIKDRGLLNCPTNGCGNLISAIPGKNKSGLCTACANKMLVWRLKGSEGLPHLIKTPTGYMTKAAFKALNQEAAA